MKTYDSMDHQEKLEFEKSDCFKNRFKATWGLDVIRHLDGTLEFHREFCVGDGPTNFALSSDDAVAFQDWLQSK